jgi:PadR family transcriptional regulator PadR
MARLRSEMLRGSLEVLILKTLSWGPAHGYAVASWIEQIAGDVLSIEEGSLYPALHRLEQRGWVDSQWGISDNNRRAKYYRLTAEGESHLRAEASAWDQFVGAVGKVLHSTHRPSWSNPL